MTHSKASGCLVTQMVTGDNEADDSLVLSVGDMSHRLERLGNQDASPLSHMSFRLNHSSGDEIRMSSS